MNKKSGVGCTTLTYNLGRLFELPIFVKKDSFMLDDNHKDYFENVEERNFYRNNEGIVDVGAIIQPYEVEDVENLITKKAKVVVIPFDFGYECIIETIETVKYVQSFNNELPIVLVLNRLDKSDSIKDFNYKEYVTLKFDDAGISFDDKVVLTYLRNSYGVYVNFDEGSYFMDNFFKSKQSKIQDDFESKKDNTEYKKLLYFINEELVKTDYRNEDIYIQDKDMVEFRNNFKDRYANYVKMYDQKQHSKNRSDKLHTYADFVKYISDNKNATQVYQEAKLIKDMAFIAHNIFECIVNKNNFIRYSMNTF